MLCLLVWGLYFGKVGKVAWNVDISGVCHSRMFGFTYHCWIGLEPELTTAFVFDTLPHFGTFEGGMFLLTEGVHRGGRKLSFAFGALPVDTFNSLGIESVFDWLQRGRGRPGRERLGYRDMGISLLMIYCKIKSKHCSHLREFFCRFLFPEGGRMGSRWWERSCSDRAHWKLPPGEHLVDRPLGLQRTLSQVLRDLGSWFGQ